jgi:hypothetical protein
MGRLDGVEQRSRLPSIASLIKKKPNPSSPADAAQQQDGSAGSSSRGSSAGGSQPLKRLSSNSYSKGVMHQRAANKVGACQHQCVQSPV